jgi:hypothetical protein
LTALIRTLAEKQPERLRRAIALITPIGRGRDFLLLVDPSTRDAAAELRRYAEAGEESPLEELFRRALRLDVPGPKP